MQSFLQRRSLKRLERRRSQSSSLIPPGSKWVSLGSHLEPRHSCICLFGVQEAGVPKSLLTSSCGPFPFQKTLQNASLHHMTSEGAMVSSAASQRSCPDTAALPTPLSRSDSGSASQHQRVCFEHRCVLEWSNGRILLLIFFSRVPKKCYFFLQWVMNKMCFRLCLNDVFLQPESENSDGLYHIFVYLETAGWLTGFLIFHGNVWCWGDCTVRVLWGGKKIYIKVFFFP